MSAPKGFRAAGVACGIKANGRPDLSLIVSEGTASAAAVFTTNLAQAAPVLVSRRHLHTSRGTMRAGVVNRGWANGCTGTGGMRGAREMASLYPRTMDPDPSQAYVMFPGTPYEHLMLPVSPAKAPTN